MNRFLSSIPWWTMEPHPELVDDPDDICLACIGRRYMVYSESGVSMTLNLAPGKYRGEWFNPVDGAIPVTQSIASFTWSGGKKTFLTPVNQNPDGASDWVLHLIADGPGKSG